MSKNSFTLQNQILLHNGKPCKIYLPPFDINGVKIYWIKYIDDGDVVLAREDSLTLVKNGNLLYGKK